ncbi:MAG: hypothetical protein JNL67_22445 [Planctomycetaceae bacterium]|nr:hypothetical protein [Planctomycetaceae bacterium]
MLKDKFIPVAIDQWYTRRQQDPEGDFYRKIAGQGPRNDFNKTTQGFYIADPAGTLIAYNNNRGPERIRKLMEEALSQYTSPNCSPIEEPTIDTKFDPQLPSGAVVVRCGAKVKGGYEQAENEWRAIFQRSVARDNLWILENELEAMARGEFPESLAKRIARFHLVDNTRGQPPAWEAAEIRSLTISINGEKVSGRIHLETEDQSRGFIASLEGEISIQAGRLKKFDVIVEGDFWGTGRFTLEPPKGKFPLVVAFRLPDVPDKTDSIPPAGTRGWLDGYLDPDR